MKTILFTLLTAAAFSLHAGVLGKPVRLDDVNRRAMAVCVDGNRLYVGASYYLYVYDITDPLHPKRLGQTAGFGNLRQLTARDGFVYVVSRETGLYIVDARDPANPRTRSRFDTVEFATGIDLAGDVAFISERQNGVEFVDISNPDRPAHIAIRKTAESQSNRYRNGWLFSGDWHSGEVTIFDAHDMQNIREVARAGLNGFGDGLTLDGRYLYASTGHDARHVKGLSKEEARGRGRGLNIIDISDPTKPRPVSRIDFPRFMPRNEDFWTVRVSNGTAFCLDSHNGLFVVDVRDPAKPSLLERFTLPQTDHPEWPSAAMSSLAVGDGCVYLTVAPGGAYVIPVAGVTRTPRQKGVPPKNAAYRESYPTDTASFDVWKAPTPGQARAVAVADDVVYAACGEAGLNVLQIGPSGGFSRIGGLPGHPNVYDVQRCGGRLYTAEGYDGFGIYEMDGVTKFREIGRIPKINGKADVAIWVWPIGTNDIVVSSRINGYHFFDIRDPAHPREVFKTFGTCLWDRYVADGLLGGRFLVISHPHKALEWIDLSGTKPISVRTEPETQLTLSNAICLFGTDGVLATDHCRYAYARAGADGLPPREGWTFRPLPQAFPDHGITGIPRANGTRVAITSRINREVAVFDFTDPNHPALEKAWKISGNPDLPGFYKGRLVIPAGHQGVLLEKKIK